MKINRIILDILDWIKDALWGKKNKDIYKGYKILQVYQGDKGILKLVERDTPRAIITYVFTPFARVVGNKILPSKDIHICLDHLWALEGSEVKHKSFKLSNTSNRFSYSKYLGKDSHSITVLEASRFVNKDGDYLTDIIFHKNYDFIGVDTSGLRDRHAIPIIKEVVMLFKERPSDTARTFPWDFEIKWSRKRFMGTLWKNYHRKPAETETI